MNESLSCKRETGRCRGGKGHTLVKKEGEQLSTPRVEVRSGLARLGSTGTGRAQQAAGEGRGYPPSRGGVSLGTWGCEAREAVEEADEAACGGDVAHVPLPPEHRARGQGTGRSISVGQGSAMSVVPHVHRHMRPQAAAIQRG